MQHYYFLLGIVILDAFLLAPTSGGEPAAEAIDLLRPAPSAGDLGHWEFFSEDTAAGFDDTWRCENGVLICRGAPLGYLYTTNAYRNFTLKLQYRLPKDAKPHKGGILFRMTGEDKIWPKSLEAQINHPDAGDFWGLDGYQLDGPAARKRLIDHSQFGTLLNLRKQIDAAKPLGEWNNYEIRAEGGIVTILIDGRVVNRATDCDITSGPILLTSEGNEIHFRNIRLVAKQPID